VQRQQENAAGQAKRDIDRSANVPLPGFVGSINVRERVMNELVQRGVITAGRQAEPLPPPS